VLKKCLKIEGNGYNRFITMATRLETQRRREALRQFLRGAALKGSLAAGEMVPPVRELAVRFELSVPVALEVVKSLAEAGVLTTVPSVGTFVGRPTISHPDLYCLVYIYKTSGQLDAIHIGFEDRISQLGGASLVLNEKKARDFFEKGTHPYVAGVFRTRAAGPESAWEISDVWQVEFGRVTPDKPRTDMVYFDNVDGGAQATRHLLQLGHTRIALLGLHGQRDDPGNFLWSQERQMGWQAAMEAGGTAAENLLFLPLHTSNPDRDSQIESARQTAQVLIARSDITAVVASNSFAARGLFEALQEARIAASDWPAVVTFDDYQVLDGFPVSALRLPWEEIGRVGAELLWQRRQGQISGPPQQRLIPMRLISRLSCRPDWAQSLGLTSSRAVLTPALQSVGHREPELAVL
jgi:hypothetical protein